MPLPAHALPASGLHFAISLSLSSLFLFSSLRFSYKKMFKLKNKNDENK